ncbi:flagellar hook-basal body complex protein [Dyella sp. M7H15-1]|uniref:flagellar hook protein FlgE n=1 Tax=Dyella sp. M7H15-1 TaxID=2501295 RepID=UPI00100511A7|nr:flagellar hook-basal body complex protein [Dyella sp. M7H15-1]QAU23974.1 flagellar hook-basal body complex protein [Dyella sp. M7H15-1]
MSLNIALSGIQAINSQLNSISNNIANSGTFGFKSGRANFASSYMSGAPQGVYVGSTTQSMSIGGNLLATGRSMDAAIQGRGFFVSRDADGSMMYSRVGMFDVDKHGFLVDAFGRHVQGYDPSGNGNIGDITVPTGAIGAEASGTLDFAGNMSADWEQPEVPFDMDDPSSYNGMQVTRVFDSLGREHTVTQYFVKGDGNSVQVYYAMDGNEVGMPTTLRFDTNGKLTSTPNLTLPLGTPNGASPMSLSLNYTGMTLYAGTMTTTTNRADGYPSGQVTGVALADDGSIQVQYSNGVKLPAGLLAIATFPDELGLNPIDGSAWQASTTSGEPIYGTAGSGLAGKLHVSALEQSNVDMTAELVNLMSAQQNYQANSKVLSTENDMMRSLMQAL